MRRSTLPRLVTAGAAMIMFAAAPTVARAQEPSGDSGVGVAQAPANQVEVTKVVQASDPAEVFTFELRLCSSALSCPGGGTFVESQQIAVGGGVASDSALFTTTLLNQTLGGPRYRIVEILPNGWRLLSSSCTGSPSGSGTSLPLTAGVQFRHTTGTAWNCTFENVPIQISVTKLTSPAGAPRDFEVHVEVCEFNILANCVGDVWVPLPGTPLVLSHGETITLPLADPTLFDRFFRVHETDPGSQWTVTVECTGSFGLLGNGSPTDIPFGQAFTLSPFDRVPAFADCTFTNSTTVGSITVENETEPEGGEDFEFTFRDRDDPSNPAAVEFSLDDEESRTFSNLFPSGSGGYEIRETELPPGWSLDDIDCGDATVRRIGRGVVVTLLAGQEVECTFTNEGKPHSGGKPAPVAITVEPKFTG